MRRSIETAEELESVVKTMKGMAAANIQRFERAVASLAEYRRGIDLGLAALLREQPQRLAALAPADTRRLAAVVFGSDHGMCGRFNQQIAEHAVEAIRGSGVAAEDRHILIVGGRVGALLEAAGLAVEESLPPASALSGVTSLVQQLLLRLQAWRTGGSAERILLCYNRSTGGARYEPHTHALFPIDLAWLTELRDQPWPTNRIPAFSLPWASLFASLVREHFYIALFRAAAESMASENASRLASMQAAERNIGQLLDTLNMRFRIERQHTITEELLDIVAGFEALSP